MAYRNRGTVRLEADATNEALEDFNAALNLNPQDVAALVGRGRVKIKAMFKGDPNEDFNAALNLDPRSSFLHWLPSTKRWWTNSMRTTPPTIPSHWSDGGEWIRFASYPGIHPEAHMVLDPAQTALIVIDLQKRHRLYALRSAQLAARFPEGSALVVLAHLTEVFNRR